MFKNLIKVKIDENGFLVDDRGIRYLRTSPIKTLETKFYGDPFVYEIPERIREYSILEREIENISPKPNSWADVAILEEATEDLELPDIDLDGKIHWEKIEVVYKIHRLEFYSLGE